MKKNGNWNKHDLYEESVQNPEFEVEFLRKIYKQHRRKAAKVFREDFCGTAVLCCEWARQVRNGRAIGIDLDKETLQWGEKNHLAKLGKSASRIQLEHANVMDAKRFKADLVAALNFSYFVFKKRSELLDYYRCVHRSLNSDGVFVVDLYGGPEAQIEQEEITEQDSGFDYVWDQAYFNPVTGETLCHIHFDLPDGTRIKKAFTYDWRLWAMPEIRDVMLDAGFKETHVYWEGTDEEDGSGNGEFEMSDQGDDAGSWVAYIVGLK